MIGWVFILFFPAIISIALINFFNNKSKARGVYLLFQDKLNNTDFYAEITKLGNNSCPISSQSLLGETNLYLVNKEREGNIEIITLKGGKISVLSSGQYKKITNILNDDKVYCSYGYSINSFDVYFREKSEMHKILIFNFQSGWYNR